jgi:hypothetical protein
MCIYILLALQFSSVALLVALKSVSRFSLHDLTDTDFSVFCQVFLTPTTFLATYDNFDELTILLSG